MMLEMSELNTKLIELMNDLESMNDLGLDVPVNRLMEVRSFINECREFERKVEVDLKCLYNRANSYLDYFRKL
jgi:hypothetical protein